MSDPVIDRSPAQIERLISESRIAINQYGYTIVRTAFLQSLMDQVDAKTSTAAHDNRSASKDAAR